MLKLIGLLISIRVLFAFLNGEILLFNSEVSLESAERYNFIFKATYYFSSFFYILGCSWLVYFRELFALRNLLINIFAFIVVTLVIILNFNLSLIFTLIFLAGIFVFYNFGLKATLKIASLSFSLMIIASIGFSRLSYGSLMIDRLTLKETSSFDARLSFSFFFFY